MANWLRLGFIQFRIHSQIFERNSGYVKNFRRFRLGQIVDVQLRTHLPAGFALASRIYKKSTAEPLWKNSPDLLDVRESLSNGDNGW